MDSGACTDLCKDSREKQVEITIDTTEVNGDVPPAVNLPEDTDCLVPITPDAVRENGDFPIEFQSPLTGVREQLKLACISSKREDSGSNSPLVDKDDNGSPRTPKDSVFDPFAPGPDIVARAPQSRKYLDELRISVTRRLNFDPSTDSLHDAESLPEQDLFKSVYENILHIIVSNQTEGVLAQISNVDNDSDDCRTPPSPLRFSGIADTCPGAPLKVKPEDKPWNIPVGLCKKLEF